MELTPIKVRGKRFRPGERDKMMSATAAKRQKTSREGSIQPRASRDRRRSYLEQLPVELLQRILIMSENLCLPCSSREIYYKLSGTSLKEQLVIAAFQPTWDVWHGVLKRHVKSYFGWQSDSARFGGNPQFQSAVLARRWAKFPLIMDSYNRWIRGHARDRVYGNKMYLGGQARKDFLLEFRKAVERDPFIATRTDVGLMELSFQVEFGYYLGQPRRQDHTAGDARRLWADISPTGGYLEVHRDTRIPDELLTGPYDEEKMCRLFWLIRGGATLSNDTNWELTYQGFEEIVACDNEDVLLKTTIYSLFRHLEVFSRLWPPQLLLDESVGLHKRIEQQECRPLHYERLGLWQCMMHDLDLTYYQRTGRRIYWKSGLDTPVLLCS